MVEWTNADTIYVLKEAFSCFVVEYTNDRSRFTERALFAAHADTPHLTAQFLNPTLPLQVLAYREKENLALSCGALYYGRSLARFVMKSDVQQVKEFLGPTRRDWAIKTANAMQLANMALPHLTLEIFMRRGQSILVAALSNSLQLMQKTLWQQLNLAEDIELPTTPAPLATSITAAALALPVDA